MAAAVILTGGIIAMKVSAIMATAIKSSLQSHSMRQMYRKQIITTLREYSAAVFSLDWRRD